MLKIKKKFALDVWVGPPWTSATPRPVLLITWAWGSVAEELQRLPKLPVVQISRTIGLEPEGALQSLTKPLSFEGRAEEPVSHQMNRVTEKQCVLPVPQP